MMQTTVRDGCGGRSPVLVMLRDVLWRAIAPFPDKRRSGILCHGCIVRRLGRPITLHDLRPGLVTDALVLGAVIGAAIVGYDLSSLSAEAISFGTSPE